MQPGCPRGHFSCLPASNRGHPTLAGPVTDELHLCVHACAYACRLAGMVNLGFEMEDVADVADVSILWSSLNRFHWAWCAIGAYLNMLLQTRVHKHGRPYLRQIFSF